MALPSFFGIGGGFFFPPPARQETVPDLQIPPPALSLLLPGKKRNVPAGPAALTASKVPFHKKYPAPTAKNFLASMI